MKRFITTIFAAVLLGAPLCAMADDAGGPPSGPNPAMMQIMEQTHAQMDKLHGQARLAMLNSLSPGHRNLLAQVAGQLAIAPNPDAVAAARQLDANLSSGEARSILNISASFKQQARQLMDSDHQQLMKAMPAGTPTRGPWGMHDQGMHAGMKGGPASSDPGMILLMAARSGGFEGFHHMFMGGPPGP